MVRRFRHVRRLDHARAVGESSERPSHEVPRLTPRLYSCERPSGGCVGGSRPCGWDGSRAGDGPGGRNGSCAGPGGPDDRRSVAVQLQLSPDGGRRRPRLRDAAAALRRRLDGHRRPSGGRRRRPDGPKVRMEQLLGPAPHNRVGTGRHESREGGENDFTRRLSTSP
jgi:hypothetical protein